VSGVRTGILLGKELAFSALGDRARHSGVAFHCDPSFNAGTAQWPAAKMTVFTLGPNENMDGPFAEVHARNEPEARKKVQSADGRRNWLDLNAVYCMPIESTATRYSEVRIYEKLEDLPRAWSRRR